MKLLCLSYEYPPVGGGGAKVVSNILNGLMGKAHEATLVTMHFRGLPFNERLGGLRILRVPCIRLKKEICYAIEMIPYLLVAVPFLCARLLKNKYDVNHTHFIFPDGLLALVVKFLFGIPYIITAHGSDVPGIKNALVRLTDDDDYRAELGKKSACTGGKSFFEWRSSDNV